MIVCSNWLSMYRLIFLTIMGIAVLADDMDSEKCKHFVNPSVLHCCSKIPMESDLNSEMKECRELPKDPILCTQELCIAKKLGTATADGKLNKTRIEESVSIAYAGAKEVAEAIKKNCIHGDLEQYGPPEFCDLSKMRNCLSVQFLKLCPEWDDKGDCKGIKESVEACSKYF